MPRKKKSLEDLYREEQERAAKEGENPQFRAQYDNRSKFWEEWKVDDRPLRAFAVGWRMFWIGRSGGEVVAKGISRVMARDELSAKRNALTQVPRDVILPSLDLDPPPNPLQLGIFSVRPM